MSTQALAAVTAPGAKGAAERLAAPRESADEGRDRRLPTIHGRAPTAFGGGRSRPKRGGGEP